MDKHIRLHIFSALEKANWKIDCSWKVQIFHGHVRAVFKRSECSIWASIRVTWSSSVNIVQGLQLLSKLYTGETHTATSVIGKRVNITHSSLLLEFHWWKNFWSIYRQNCAKNQFRRKIRLCVLPQVLSYRTICFKKYWGPTKYVQCRVYVVHISEN